MGYEIDCLTGTSESLRKVKEVRKKARSSGSITGPDDSFLEQDVKLEKEFSQTNEIDETAKNAKENY